ncbi:transcription factor bHLH96-like [Punica granatum]|uniref:BHLH domain-containing protein n=2 Tax=Punica granatum TaxID=22663 RepID=A0A218VZC9_PUNGR|nr:transcription factor bHLH96-like [Punica granatum]OWM65653.1 hypothetical protein CDL15_Pgr017150 [Punica granatum]PKI46772.1 hypothetical protein CRG98_032844 [Punica granatum]
MALETVVFQQDPFSCKDSWPYSLLRQYLDDADHQDSEYYSSSTARENSDNLKDNLGEISTNSSASSEDNGGGTGGFPSVAAVTVRRKRRRARPVKNTEEVENQRMTHIAVERNRRRQMNDYLAILRSMMPPSYVQRGDQASIIGGAINFVKELEQLHHSLEALKETNLSPTQHSPSIFSDFFTFPQYSTTTTRHSGSSSSEAAIADVEVTVADGHANIKVRSRRQPAQLLKMVLGLHSLRLHVLHLTVTAADPVVLFSFSAKVEESCELNSANEIAAAVHELVARIQEQACCV